jgi:hypothetical protein
LAACGCVVGYGNANADAIRSSMRLCGNTSSKAAPSTGRLTVHTQPFAFRAPEEDDESVKISNTISRRTGAATPALPAARPRDSEHATSIAILHAKACPPQARISPSFSVTSAFLCVLCVKSFALLGDACPQNRQFLFDTNEPLPNLATHTKQTTSVFLRDASEWLSRTSNLAIHTKQNTSLQMKSFFLFDTNERLPNTDRQSLITTHQSLITNHQSPITKTRRTP